MLLDMLEKLKSMKLKLLINSSMTLKLFLIIVEFIKKHSMKLEAGSWITTEVITKKTIQSFIWNFYVRLTAWDIYIIDDNNKYSLDELYIWQFLGNNFYNLTFSQDWCFKSFIYI